MDVREGGRTPRVRHWWCGSVHGREWIPVKEIPFRGRELDPESGLESAQAWDLEWDREKARALVLESDRVSDLEKDQELDLVWDPEKDRALVPAWALVWAQALDQASDQEMGQALDQELDLALDRVLGLAWDLDLVQESGQV